MNELGGRLRAAREAAKVSLSKMAAKTHYSKTYLWQLENNQRVVRPEHVTAYSRALSVAVDALYGPPLDPLRLAHEWLVSDTPVAVHRKAGRRVGASLVHRLESRVIELRHLDDTVGGGDLSPLVQRELSDVAEVVNDGSYTELVGRRLRVVVGELAQLAGWVASDAGAYAQAQHAYLDGVSAAREAGDGALVGQLFSSLAYQLANVGDPADAQLLARSAVTGARRASPVVRTLLLERLAWASARARDREATRRALDEVDVAFERRTDDVPEPERVYWMSRDEIDVMAGRCLIELGDPVAAAPLLTAAIARYDEAHAREVALYRTWLAESYARAGELDAARAALAEAQGGSADVNSARLVRRMGEVELLILHR
ncbi:helix-turn-helix transcriptional regulator [Amycolatopsis sp., V23-08]|uniref:Helix-turn-helix transcriptional regulator n=1 Tax=Amycolatopsis heterodermiae TaxID=3110235 RepID=A0ABU5RLM1_9PSEU|nr:helix-turn-helix transcriptional regulator [Amycolatopsis sp., V23-08]MEA5367193.1 helix-turn-helix transcriptional regulator [Amycolatopsis sp., V23-08]